MNRAEAVQKLKGYAEPIRAMGATSLYVFGSTVRDEASEIAISISTEHTVSRHRPLQAGDPVITGHAEDPLAGQPTEIHPPLRRLLGAPPKAGHDSGGIKPGMTP